MDSLADPALLQVADTGSMVRTLQEAQGSAGNQAVQRVLTADAGDGPAVQRDVSETIRLDRLWRALSSGDEEGAIETMGLLDADETATALHSDRYRAAAVRAFDNDEMFRAIRAARHGTLWYSLIWLFEEGTDWPKVREIIRRTRLAAERATIIRGDTDGYFLRNFTDICNNVEMAEAVNLLGGPLKGRLLWMQEEGTDAELVRRTIGALSPTERQAARTDPSIRVLLRELLSSSEAQFMDRMLDQGLVAEETGVTREVEETLWSGPTTGAFTSGSFGGTGKFDIAYYADRLQVTVKVALNPVDDQARNDLGTVRSQWKTNIEAAWNGKFHLENRTSRLALAFTVEFGSGGHHTVDVHSGVPKWPGLNMTNWYTTDLVAPDHEFGHMIGNPDEYFLDSRHYREFTGSDPSTDPNARKEVDATGRARYKNTRSLMGSGTDVQARHVDHLVDWLNAHRRQDAQGSATEARYRLVTGA